MHLSLAAFYLYAHFNKKIQLKGNQIIRKTSFYFLKFYFNFNTTKSKSQKH